MGDELAESLVGNLGGCRISNSQRPTHGDGEGLDQLGSKLEWLALAHRVAHTIRVRGVTSEVEGGSVGLTPL